MTLQLTSSAFSVGELIPLKYTCDGEDFSPPLAWNDPPPGTKSFALICDDPDAPGRTWVHWVRYNIPADARDLAENQPNDAHLPDGSLNGTNSWKRLGYGGPCPPRGVHHYYFKLYALDTMLDLPAGATKEQLLDAMLKHIVTDTELMGVYQRR